jgi:hypothetical protein
MLLTVGPVAAVAAGLTVPVDQSRRLPINGAAASIVVGNDDIAAVKAVDTRTLMVVGKRQGVTNVVVLDAGGRTLFDGEIVVSANTSAMVTVFRGAQSSQYACAPYCTLREGAGSGSPAAPASAGVPIETVTAEPAPAATP